MSVTAFEDQTASKSLEDAGFTDVQIVALMGCMHRSDGSGAPALIQSANIVRAARDHHAGRGGSIGHALAMLVLAIGGLGALVAILIRVA